MRNTLHTFETYKQIFDLEERRGRLKESYFSDGTQRISANLKEERNKLKGLSKKQKEDKEETIKNLKAKYEEARNNDIRLLYQSIQKGEFTIQLKTVDAKGKTGFTTANTESMVLCKLLLLELKRSYKYTPANRNDIIEELRALLDNAMPKVVIRADIHHFFESIPQDKLMGRILEDAYLSASSLKTLKTFLYEYNELADNVERRVGVPRGLAFSPYLAEIYMAAFDRKVRQIEGVYYYKRYVDDIILIAKPGEKGAEDYWEDIEKLAVESGLQLNNEEEKRKCVLFSPNFGGPLALNYLGYQFLYSNGRLEVLLTEKKFNRYKECIKLIFENYHNMASYTSRKIRPKVKKTDTTIQFMHRLNALTGNGRLNGRKNFVLVGIYYSNKYITNLGQLHQLDDYVRECVNNETLFSPPKSMFQYETGSDYEYYVDKIKEKILSDYSFVKGFETRRLYRWPDYTNIVRQTSALYYFGHNDE